MISHIPLNNLRNGDFILFLLDILAIVEQNDPARLKVNDQFNFLQQLSNHIEVLSQSSEDNVFNNEIAKLDERRDNAINGINAIITAYTYSTDPILRNHALILANNLSNYGTNIAKTSFQSETVTLQCILNDWETKPGLAKAIEALGLNTWRKELVESNSLFNERYMTKTSETGKSTSDIIKLKRMETNGAYFKLRNRLNSYLDIHEGADPWGTTVRSMNRLIENYNFLLLRRGIKKGKADDPPQLI